MILNDFNQMIRENFDLSDDKTRRLIVTLEDADQSQVLTALASALYDKIVQKVDKVDFGTIPRSRGDITKVDGFENTVECLNIMRRLVIEYKENPQIIDNVITAIENVKTRKGMFMKAFAMNVELPMLFYNLIVLSIEQSVSFLIAVCIQYIKDPASGTMSAALDKVSYNNCQDNLLYDQLVSFNKSCSSKEFDNSMDQVIKNAGKLHESFTGNDDCAGGVNSIIINVGKGNDVGSPSKCPSPFKQYNDPEEQQPVNGDCVSGDCAQPVEPGPFEEPVIEGVINQLKMPSKIKKFNRKNGTPVNNLGDYIKLGGNPGFNNLVKECDDLDDLAYLLADINSIIPTIKIVKERIDKCNKLGDCEETKYYYKGINKLYISKGITTKDCDKALAGSNETVRLCKNRIKELRKSTNEAAPVVVAGAIVGGALLGLQALKFTLQGLKTLINVIIPTMRKCVYYCIHSVVSFSDCLYIQGQLIEANAYKLQYSMTSDLDDDKRAKVVKKQLKIADILKKWSNKFAIDSKKATREAESLMKSENKKIVVDDIKDELSPDIYNDLF